MKPLVNLLALGQEGGFVEGVQLMPVEVLVDLDQPQFVIGALDDLGPDLLRPDQLPGGEAVRAGHQTVAGQSPFRRDERRDQDGRELPDLPPALGDLPDLLGVHRAQAGAHFDLGEGKGDVHAASRF